MRPAAVHLPFRPIESGRITSRFDEAPTSPNQLRWNPLPIPVEPTDFVAGLMAFMFETRWMIQPTRFALETAQLQSDYFNCWQGLKKHFRPER